MVFCPKCGEKQDNNEAKFCQKCGEDIGANTETFNIDYYETVSWSVEFYKYE